MPSSRMWHRLVLAWNDVSEEGIASIFRVEKSASEKPASESGCRLGVGGDMFVLVLASPRVLGLTTSLLQWTHWTEKAFKIFEWRETIA
jgi:hypothetical protein